MKDRKLLNSELGRLTPEEYRTVRPSSGIVLVLDNVRSAHNVGSAFRTADAFGVDKVYLGGICPVPPSPELHKVALGAEESVPSEHVDDVVDLGRRLQAAGYTVIAVEQTEHSVKLDEFCAGVEEGVSPRGACPPPDKGRGRGPLDTSPEGTQETMGGAGVERSGTESPLGDTPSSKPRYALVFGNEVHGVQQEVVDACDFALEIPQKGTKHSLNVSVSIGVVLWALVQRMNCQAGA
jgi:tRNA G18 (ribose-2'-O)-methylase SpoU